MSKRKHRINAEIMYSEDHRVRLNTAEVAKRDGSAACDGCGERRLIREMWSEEWLPKGAGKFGLETPNPGEQSRADHAKKTVNGLCRQCRYLPPERVEYHADDAEYEPGWVSTPNGLSDNAFSRLAENKYDDSMELLIELQWGIACRVCRQYTLEENLVDGMCRACGAPPVVEGIPLPAETQPPDKTHLELLHERRTKQQLEANLNDLRMRG